MLIEQQNLPAPTDSSIDEFGSGTASRIAEPGFAAGGEPPVEYV